MQGTTTYLHANCSGKFDYASLSRFQVNLNRLLVQRLYDQGSTYDFFNDTKGEDPDKVYGLFLCRGDVQPDNCQSCIEEAGNEIQRQCPYSKEAIIWYDECLVRYSYRSFFSIMQRSPSFHMYSNSTEVVDVADLDRIGRTLNETFDDLTRLISNVSRNMLYATKQVAVSSSLELYGLVQCTPDLTVPDCQSCLRSAIALAQVPNASRVKQGGRVLTPNCNIRYETYLFYGEPRDESPDTSMIEKPGAESLENEPRGTDVVEGQTKWIAMGVTVFGVNLIFSGAVFLWRRRRYFQENEDSNSQEIKLIELGGRVDDGGSNANLHVENGVRSQEFPSIQLGILQAATKQFCDENKLGEGGFGPVYKSETLLVYEFMPNKSLDVFLFDSASGVQLDWQNRLSIVNGIARGILNYEMLEKIGLPAKPSLRGSNWVVDASHCQGCSSQFTFINRKHHCRRCGGLFCGTCTQKRMVLRGQGDSPVRICEPCKTLEEAARFELRHGYKSKAGKGSSKPAAKNEDDLLNQILGADRKESSSSGVISNKHMSTSVTRSASSASWSNVVGSDDGGGEIRRSQSVDQRMQNDMASLSPEELRQQALDEKRKYKILKGEGKPEEALRAFKRGKELERQAESLEIYIRKNRKRSLPSGNMSEIQNKDAAKESGRKTRASSTVGKDDLAAELRELGWSDMDLHNENKGSASMSLEGELSSLLGEMPKKSGKHGPDKAQVVAIKKKALMLKREGKLAEAKEELKRAKILEKQLEEQELLAGADDSDDELSAIIHSMDNDKEDEMLIQYEHTEGFDFGHLLGAADDIDIDSNFEATDNDMEDPEIAAALKSLGWAEDSNPSDDVVAQSAPVNREALLNEILSLKREALSQKRAGNVAEAMAQLKKAKLLEKDLENFDSQPENLTFNQNVPTPHTVDISVKSAKLGDDDANAVKDMELKPARKSKLAIQKELLGLKKKALALRREGRLDEAEEELKKGKILEQQLEDMENTSNTKAAQVTIGSSMKDSKGEYPSMSVTLPVEGEDVTDQDMHDPTYLSILRNLGWNENDDELSDSFPLTQSPPKIPAKASRRSKAEIQRELLGLKRKALSLRRQGNTDEAEEVLEATKALEAELAEMEATKKVVESKWPNEKAIVAPLKGVVEEVDENVTENDMTDPAMLSVLKNLGWKDDKMEPVTMQEKHSKHLATESLHSGHPSITQPSSGISASPPRSKREIERELLDLKRRALALRRKGQAEEAEDLLQKAKVLEAEMAELEAPKGELVFDVSRDSKPQNIESFANNERQTILKNEVNSDFGFNFSSLAKTDAPSSSQNLRTKDEDTVGKSRPINGEQKAHVLDVNSNQEAFTSQNNQDSLRQAILSHKKKALALKRDGKLAEAREELQQAKLLEKTLTQDGTPPKSGTNDGSISASTGPSAAKEKGASTVAPKPLSGRDRFKLQQESLSHKRQALKLRREGRIEEAEAEFEIAKSLEAQLEKSAGHDSTNTGAGKADDVVVEDLLDPQLLSALKAIGLDDSGVVEHSPEKTQPVKLNTAKTDDVKQERIQLEERIKAEKVKAVNLKRSGKQAEALDALRRAKMLEKKLNSLS
ncbi:hypothetical protein V6N13_032650 [Hibiscus sabdariffa]